MHRVAHFKTPALVPALLFSSALFLQGCSLLPKKDAAEDESGARPVAGDARDGAATRRGDAFTLEVRGPDDIRDYLALHLEIQRYRQIPDLGSERNQNPDCRKRCLERRKYVHDDVAVHRNGPLRKCHLSIYG